MPILGTVASSTRQGLSTGSYESIATINVVSNTASVTFSDIPNTYKHLQIRGSVLTSAPNNDCALRFNSDTGSNYHRHAIYGTGSTVLSFTTTPATAASVSFSQPTGVPGVFVADILDYANTNKRKTLRSIWGYDNPSGADYNGFYSSLWANTNAITSITIFNTLTSSTINQYTSIGLYGIKG
jgi:hypothetical protein